jgi:hypothetical protein
MGVRMIIRPASETTVSLVMLEPLKRRVIMYLRLLRNAAAGRAEVEQDLVARAGLGSERSLNHLELLERLGSRALDRPLNIGSMEKARATEDEMVLAQLIAAAADGRTRDCYLQASRVAGRDECEPLVSAAKLAGSLIAVGEVARCSCGKTGANHDRLTYGD